MAETVEDDSKVDDIIKSAERLVNKDQMGEVYKVCCITTGGQPTGFEGEEQFIWFVCCHYRFWLYSGIRTKWRLFGDSKKHNSHFRSNTLIIKAISYLKVKWRSWALPFSSGKRIRRNPLFFARNVNSRSSATSRRIRLSSWFPFIPSVKQMLTFISRTLIQRTNPSERQSVSHEGMFCSSPHLMGCRLHVSLLSSPRWSGSRRCDRQGVPCACRIQSGVEVARRIWYEIHVALFISINSTVLGGRMRRKTTSSRWTR